MKKLFCYGKKDFCDRYKGNPNVLCNGCEFFDDTGSEEREVDEAEGSSADVVQVVRCKNCKHWKETCKDILLDIVYGECHSPNSPYRYEEDTHGNDFCSYGERKE